MGFKLKNALKSVAKGVAFGISPIAGIVGSKLLDKSKGGGDAGGAPAFNQLPPPPERRSLKDILSDPSFGYSDAPVGPGIEDNTAAYEAALMSGEAARRREEDAATNRILEGLQGRGIARSGIALKDVVSQVLGPSSERANSLAAQFGLAQAQDRSDVLSQQRQAANALNQQKLGGRLSSILGYDTGNTNLNLSSLESAAAERRQGLADASQRQMMSEERKRQRRSGLGGLLGGIGGSIIGGPVGGAVGGRIGGSLF